MSLTDESKGMRFLWLTRESPLNPDRGDLLYSNGILRALLAAGAEGVMLGYARSGKPDPKIAGLDVRVFPPQTTNRAFSLLTALPSDAYRNRSAAFAAGLNKALDEGVDAIIIDYYTMGWTLPLIQAHPISRGERPPVRVYLTHQDEQTLRPQVAKEAGGSLPMRAVLTIDAYKSVRMDKALADWAEILTANTDEDRAVFLKRNPDKTAITLTPAYDREVDADAPIDQARPRRVVMVGGFDWIAKRHNLVSFLEGADPIFQSAGLELHVVGRAEPGFMQSTAARFGCVRFEGRVETVGPYLREARIGLMPDQVGAGFKHKYLDYIFHGLPVATIRSQAVGLPLDIEQDMIAADDPEALATAIVEAIDDVGRLDGMRRRAFAACRDAFHWRDRGVALYQAITGAR